MNSVLLSPAMYHPSAVLQEVIDSVILETGALARTVTPEGGVKVSDLRDVLRDVATKHGLVHPTGNTFAASELTWENHEKALAVAIQAGRAATNNGGLASVMAAAARPDIDWLILVLPERYKRGTTYGIVLKQVSALAAADGIDLDLVGVTLIGF